MTSVLEIHLPWQRYGWRRDCLTAPANGSFVFEEGICSNRGSGWEQYVSVVTAFPEQVSYPRFFIELVMVVMIRVYSVQEELDIMCHAFLKIIFPTPTSLFLSFWHFPFHITLLPFSAGCARPWTLFICLLFSPFNFLVGSESYKHRPKLYTIWLFKPRWTWG